MLHNHSLLGFSLLVLSCASPTLGVPAEPASALLEPVSAPSSPALGSHPAFNPVNPVSVQPTESRLDATERSSVPRLQDSPAQVSPDGSAVPTSINPPIKLKAAETFSTTTHSLVESADVSESHGEQTASDLQSATDAVSGTPTGLQADKLPATPSAMGSMKHSKISSSAHKKLASKLKSMNPASSGIAFSPTSLSAPGSLILTTPTSQAVQATGSVSQPSSLSASSISVFSTPIFSTTRPVVESTTAVFNDPNPDVRSQKASDATQRARRSAILAAFLILSTLGALGGGVLCFKCGVLPCCHRKGRPRSTRASLERTIEEGLQKPQRVTSIEKSIIPGAPPLTEAALRARDLPILSRDSHTLSCSTCPDSMDAVRGGVSGGAADWRVYATNDEGRFEDVTHILSTDAFSGANFGTAPINSAPASPSPSATSSAAWSHRASSASSGSGPEPRSSVHSTSDSTVTSCGGGGPSRPESRASGSGASMTAESYKSCESRYSTPSFEQDPRDRIAASASASASPSPSPSLSPSLTPSLGGARSPSPAASPILLHTPGAPDYAGLADAALPAIVVESEGEDMEIDTDAEGEVGPGVGGPWDVARAYGVRGPDAKTAQGGVGTVDLGGRTCVLIRG
ncbi:hypothetical protein BD413DRAFT_611392 [Trametes elegans]|nr:hypothetical protein BD413DRAFT_611392 [Trametes elegans]